MKTLAELCKPRSSVFDRKLRDTVLDLSDLAEKRIEPKVFFAENYLTSGMEELFKQAFMRFSGKSDGGVIKLTQVMGGGKTHCMIALGLLAQNSEYRKDVIGNISAAKSVGEVRVVSFTGRESDVPYGIWGAIAKQLGKEDHFRDYYSPLKAPGQTAWISLLQGEPLLILLDEIPPYLVNAKSVAIGNGDLCEVTVTALSNLFTALGKAELSNVCLVISDLKSSYEAGSERIANSLHNLEQESQRGAINLEPVQINSDEVYQILKRRLFEQLPSSDEIDLVAKGYESAIKDAEQMNLTSYSPEKMAHQIRDSYPFHPGIRDLYARFRENANFQQTRGLIRLMRTILAGMFTDGGAAYSSYLIHPHEINLNDQDVASEFSRINPALGNAISHDIASAGNAEAEKLDIQRGDHDASDVARLIFVSSLANVHNAVIGLTDDEVLVYLASPKRNLADVKNAINTLIYQRCWYLHKDAIGRIHFRDIQNLNAKLRSYAEGYSRETAIIEIRDYLGEIFKPEKKDCYQDVLILPAIDDINVQSEKVLLILFEPSAGRLNPDLEGWYGRLDYKNRVSFLSGQKETMDSLIQNAKDLKAIRTIIVEMDADKVRTDSPQYVEASEFKENIQFRLLSAAKESFTVLWYPQSGELRKADLIMAFTNNRYRAEEQIRQTLKEKQKFTDEVDTESFRKKCEIRLFTQPQMKWSEIKLRAAAITEWQWCHPSALDNLKTKLVQQDQWREDRNGYVDKGPFPQEPTSVSVQVNNRNKDTGEVILRISPIHGDTVYYEIGGDATPSSAKVPDLHQFKTKEMKTSFLCVDSSGVHEQGPTYTWTNTLTLQKFVQRVNSEVQKVELKSAPDGAEIKYSTDGSNPKTAGGVYSGSFDVKKGAPMLRAIGIKNGVESEELTHQFEWGKEGKVIDPTKPARWHHDIRASTTKETFDLLEWAGRHEASIVVTSITIGEGLDWVQFSASQSLQLKPTQVEQLIAALREVHSTGQVQIDIEETMFPTGKHLLDAAGEQKCNPTDSEVFQE